MLTAVLTGLMVVLYSLQSLFTRLYSKYYRGSDASAAVPVFSLCYGLIIALCSWVSAGFGFAPSPATWLFGALNAVILMVYNLSMIQGGRAGSYSALMLCSLSGGILVPLISGWLFLNEKLSALQLGAVALMLVSIALLNSKDFSLKGASGRFLGWCALLFFSNGLYGVVLALQARRLDGAERSEMLVILFALSALLSLAGELVSGKGRRLCQGFAMGWRSLVSLLLCCASAFVAASLALRLLTLVPSGLLYTVDNGGVLVLSFLYAVLLFHEKPQKRETAGIALAVVSIILISL